MKNQEKTQDWANLTKYQTQNSQLQIIIYEEKRIVFMGDSITEIWSTIYPQFFLNKPYINRGISGQTTPQMLVRFRADVVALHPTAVIILAGINDIAGNTGFSSIEMIRDNIFSMVEIAKANQIKVIICSILPAADFSWKPNQEPIEKIKDLNKILINYATENDLIYVDYYSSMVDDKGGLKIEFSNDGVHPNIAGYQIMAPLVEKAIERALMKN
ncbi:Lysophospholipase L1 [Flavobacterium micromati]|uniref:Lysophospholipase L1 n=1 Tax=Flavobacterium micromati TaxID=229205 RepID=A0A1M5IJ91_9FLAO|nr:SGNH/GDSL hydrolase family protein [Flavobacterium micromati]SHG28408.1 Lysophospholipase L1 [Flavobacterium micromati]